MNLSVYGKVLENTSLLNFNTYKVDSTCKYLIIVNDKNKLKKLIEYLNNNNIKYFVIGGGSNIILPHYYNGVVIKLEFNNIKINKNKVIVGSSYYLPRLVIKTVSLNLSGLEWGAGIPGTVGGSVIINAGAYNDEMINYVEKVEILEHNEIKLIDKKDIKSSYRQTSLKNNSIIVLNVHLKLKPGNKKTSLDIIKDRQERRASSQPLEYSTGGSVFRNPPNDYAGRLIEESGLKGYRVGGAEISEKHANFIINYNKATSEDIVQLIDYVHKTVLDKYNVDLILEQEIIN